MSARPSRPASRDGAGSTALFGELAMVVAHEVRNALAGIGSAVEVIGQGFPAGTEERRAVDEVRLRVLDLETMAQELVRFAPSRPLRRASCSARALLGAVRVELGALNPPLALEVCGPDLALFADAELLGGAVVQLCEPAGRASPSRAARVTLAASPSAVELRIEPGEEVRRPALEPPPSPGASVSSPRAGRTTFDFRSPGGERVASDGLGLAVARRVAEAHGGRLSPLSERGAVTLTLPSSGLAAATPSE